MELDKAIKSRHSVRRFSTKKPNWREIIEAIDAANQSPLAGSIWALRFVLIDDEEKIKKLAEASQQDFVSQVHYAVVVCSDTASVVKSYDSRGEMYCRQQAGAAIENFLLKITDLGLASCWVGAFVDEEVKRILEIPPQNYDTINVEAILPIGFEMPKKGEHGKKANLDNILWFNRWKNRQMREMHKPEAV